MSHSMAKRRKKSDYVQSIEIAEHEDGHSEALIIPDDNDSDYPSSDSESDDFDKKQNSIPNVSYSKVLDSYDENQSKLEPDYIYSWKNGEYKYNNYPENENLLSAKTIKFIRDSSLVELFELFFSLELKNHIIDSTRENGYNLTMIDLDIFVGIIITSIFNQRKSQRDYWSNNLLLSCPIIIATMARDKFLTIKSKIKFSKLEEQSLDDRAWRVRTILEIFKKNAQKFGYFSTALSVDEMMVKLHGRTVLLQFMKDKPARFGIKMWGICSPDGYLFDCDIYCGKGSNIYSTHNDVKLCKCALGSRVVLMMVQKLLLSTSAKKITEYHLYFDNFFCNPDLMIHLKKIGLKATGTVRRNRVNIENEVDKKAARGTVSVKHEEKSGLNFITVMDSKPVSILSTVAGVEPLSSTKRYSKESKSKIEIPFPMANKLYNKHMGGVDLHDGHCSNLMPCLRAKKWTWAMFLRLIQSSLTNALVLHNLSSIEKKIGSKDIALAIAEKYLAKKTDERLKCHIKTSTKHRRNCVNFKKCSKRTTIMCIDCKDYFCDTCFDLNHNNY
ncbi:piggyBac transposable element-derived protein 3-like [Phymastichus coffea]|uniref:piggyBac transposable element-derived protein 3-like n=1 Tax=Phymastichus coffea TaxID=108790 RepID=UPI00273B06C3|nr:piggyBac transposable element-derived protein 3-like [Phymastichus coffea]